MRVLLVSDLPLLLDGMARAVGNSATVVGLCSDPDKLAGLIEASHPDLVILDIEHRAFRWMRAVEAIRSKMREVSLVCVSCGVDLEFLNEMGALGARTKRFESGDSRELVAFVREASMPPAASLTRLNGTIVRLTTREREVLKHVVDGEMSLEISQSLRISVRTVEFHRASILRKTGSRTVADLIRLAWRVGMLGRENA